MDLATNLKPPEALAEPTDPLSQAWCFSALQVVQPGAQERSLTTSPKMDNALTLDNEDCKATSPPLKLDDVKSWIWLQRAIHPEVHYDGCFQKRWFSSKISPWKSISIKKWMKETKQKRKEELRLQRAEVHAAISVAGTAAALAAVAAENAEMNPPTTSRENAVASAAALIAAQCARMAEAAGAKREQLTTALNAAVAATDANAILTLTAAASTSLRGAATLRGRPGRMERTNSRPALPTEECNYDLVNWRALLAKGTELLVVTADGTSKTRLVCVVLNRHAKLILKIKKIHTITALGSTQESIVHDLHGCKDKDTVQNVDSYYSIVMATSRGEVELKITDSESYKIWSMTINHMLMLSTSFTKFEVQFCEK